MSTMRFLRAFWKFIRSESRLEEGSAASTTPRRETPPRLRFTRRKERVHVQVGLDFGTSATKVVFSQLGARFFQALSFDHELPGYEPFCIPSLAAIKKGRLLLGVEAAQALLGEPWNSGLRRFKVLVAGSKDQAFRDAQTHQEYLAHCDAHGLHLPPSQVAAVFLAGVMNACAEKIRGLRRFRGADLDISYNICVPIDHLENPAVQEEFERVFRWAEVIAKPWAMAPKGFDPLEASNSLDPSDHQIGVEEQRVFAIPESVAEVASYLISLRKKDGLHAVIDLGAGTTDVSIFNLVTPYMESTSYWYAARNIPMGAVRVERRLAEVLRSLDSGRVCTQASLAEALSRGAKADLTRLARIELEEIWESRAYNHAWGDAYGYKLRKQSRWENVEVFLCGGGARLPGAENVFRRPWSWSNLKGVYPVSQLPVPENYDPGPARAPFSRLAVAYGLAIPKPQLERYVLPRRTPDQTPPELPQLDLESMFVGKDQV